MSVAQSQPFVPHLAEATTAAEVVAWTYRHFAAESVVITSAFGMEGCLLLDLLARLDRPLTVHFADTGFLFPETHALRRRLAARYPNLSLVAVEPALSPEAQASAHGPALWSRDPDRCCSLRKIEPLARVLMNATAWITAIRRTQSPARAATPLIGWDRTFRVIKVAPLANWSRRQVLDYVVEHDLPVNELHSRGYPSIGCTHCTKPVEGAPVDGYSRAGRWAGGEKTECGLHAAAEVAR